MKCVNCGCDAEVVSKGKLMNEKAWFASQIVSLRVRIPQLEKEARRTPPKTLVAERKKVEDAKVALVRAKEDLRRIVGEWTQVCVVLGDPAHIWCMHVNAFLVWNDGTQTFVKER